VEQPLASSSLALGTGGANGQATPGTAGNALPPRPLPIAAAQDEQTLSQLRRGHFSAMEELVGRYQDRLFATVLRLVGHPEDAADLVQETFVKAMQNVARFEGKSSLYTWLFRIAVNLSISHRRSRSYRDAVSLDAEPEEGDSLNRQAAGLRRQLSQDTESDPALIAQVHLEHERVLAALQQLEPDFRAIIVLRDVEDCDYEQIAAILEVPVGTVKSRLFRARSALREAVAEKSKTGQDGSNGRPAPTK
jgi:RNA polymerase sigma-70 factor (ECF subfamily)